jgi:acetamidase/formamidase
LGAGKPPATRGETPVTTITRFGAPVVAACALFAGHVEAQEACQEMPASPAHHMLPANADTVHWGYFSKERAPQLYVHSGDLVTLETLTHHANDDAARMVQGDPGAESVFRWDADGKGVDRRGAGPIDASALGRGAGEGFGVHILTGPIFVCGAEPGDVLEVKILDLAPRPSANPDYAGKTFGSNAAAW